MSELIIEELAGKNGLVGRITLNRPHALNALTKSMCEGIFECLMKWSENPKIKLLIIKGAGEKAFCAGGDIRQIHLDGPFSEIEGHDFFSKEYKMNAALFHFKKPYFAFWNGIVMGGGVGISLHGSTRIATEKLVFAMPETAIGFYPDVGVAYQLSRLPKKIGWFLGLCGRSIDAGDALHYGLATHFVPSSKMNEFENSLIASADENTLADFAQKPLPSALQVQEDFIESVFQAKNLEEAIHQIKNSANPFAATMTEDFERRSPTSLKFTWELLKRAQHLSFDQIIKQNYQTTLRFLKGHDFFEGVRAQIIDKDKNPKWQPPALHLIMNEEIEAYFSA